MCFVLLVLLFVLCSYIGLEKELFKGFSYLVSFLFLGLFFPCLIYFDIVVFVLYISSSIFIGDRKFFSIKSSCMS